MLLPAHDGAHPHGPYLKKIRKRASDTCWRSHDRELSIVASILFKSCKKWKSLQARHPVARGPAEVQEAESAGPRYPSSLLKSPAVLDFLRSTGVGKTVPRRTVRMRMRIRRGRAGRLGRRIRKMCDVLSALLSLLLRLQSGG